MGRPKGKTRSIPAQFDPADDVEEVAHELIPKYHSHLANAEIAYLFYNKEIKRKGKRIAGTAETCGKKVKALCDKDFVITISYPVWKDLEDEQRLALVDHELEHCLVTEKEDGSMKCSTIPHDMEEFNAIISRHGLYHAGLEMLSNTILEVVEQANNNNEDEISVEDEDDED